MKNRERSKDDHPKSESKEEHDSRGKSEKHRGRLKGLGGKERENELGLSPLARETAVVVSSEFGRSRIDSVFPSAIFVIRNVA